MLEYQRAYQIEQFEIIRRCWKMDQEKVPVIATRLVLSGKK